MRDSDIVFAYHARDPKACRITLRGGKLAAFSWALHGRAERAPPLWEESEDTATATADPSRLKRVRDDNGGSRYRLYGVAGGLTPALPCNSRKGRAKRKRPARN
jgi:hypothetical protein